MASRQYSKPSEEDPGSGPFTSSLSALFVLHRGLGSTDEAASEAEQYEKILYYYPGTGGRHTNLAAKLPMTSIPHTRFFLIWVCDLAAVTLMLSRIH